MLFVIFSPILHVPGSGRFGALRNGESMPHSVNGLPAVFPIRTLSKYGAGEGGDKCCVC